MNPKPSNYPGDWVQNPTPTPDAIAQDNGANPSPTLHPANDINTLTYGATPVSAQAGLDNASIAANPDAMHQYSGTMRKEVGPAAEKARNSLVGINILPGQFPQADALIKQVGTTVDDHNTAVTLYEKNVNTTAQGIDDSASNLNDSNNQATTLAGSGATDGSSGATIILSSSSP